jgi:coenzyme Q-binding protein COQ10
VTPVAHKAERVVPFSAEQVFDVVANVNAYKEFLPFCQDSRILAISKSEREFDADVTVGIGFLTGTYRSRVITQRPHSIDIKAIHSSLFEFLVSSWRFANLDQGCKVSFNIQFKAASIVHAQALNKIFPDIANQQLKAFEQRCQELYRK